MIAITIIFAVVTIRPIIIAAFDAAAAVVVAVVTTTTTNTTTTTIKGIKFGYYVPSPQNLARVRQAISCMRSQPSA